MATFSVWLQAHAKSPKPKHVTWVCGTERVLVDDVLTQTEAALDLRPWSKHIIVLGEDTERDVWDAAMQFPMELEDRLIVVHNAERMKNFFPLKAFLEARRRNPTTFLVFVSNAPRAEKTKGDKEAGTKPELLPHLRVIQRFGRIVECRKFTNTTAKHAVTWMQARASLPSNTAKHLLMRANGDLTIIRDACAKLAVLPQKTSSEVSLLIEDEPSDTFADALMMLDRKGALSALRRLTDDERASALYELSDRLNTARHVNDMMAERAPKDQIRAMLKTRGQAHLIDHLMDQAKYYNPKRGLAVRKILNSAIQAHESGARTGVLESVIAVW